MKNKIMESKLVKVPVCLGMTVGATITSTTMLTIESIGEICRDTVKLVSTPIRVVKWIPTAYKDATKLYSDLFERNHEEEFEDFIEIEVIEA